MVGERGNRTEEGGGSGRELVKSASVCYESPVPVREAPPNCHPYPPPLAKYDDIIANPKLFMQTLEKLHHTMGTKFMIPIIGGKELDLHRLFVEVTVRGGIEKIIRERRWKDVTSVFNFPSTATNASFVLRKYYVSLLHHYEQIYFFGSQGWTSPFTAFSQSPSPSSIPAQEPVEPKLPAQDVQVSASQKRRKSSGEFLPGATPMPVGYPVVGVIDGKFEHGYLVTVTVGTETLKGVLYHTSVNSGFHLSHRSSVAASSGGKEAATLGVRRRRRRKKSEIRRRDPAHPKPNRSGYNFFFAEQHARLKPLHPGKDREISKMIGELWNKLTETEKAVYQEQGVKDKERYRSEMEEYRERLRTGQIISNAVPIQQRFAVPEVTMVETDTKAEIEGVSPQTPGNESISGGSDSDDEKTADKDSEMVTSPGGENGAESVDVAEEQTAEGKEGFELRKRDQKDGEGSKDQVSSLGDAAEITKKESID